MIKGIDFLARIAGSKEAEVRYFRIDWNGRDEVLHVTWAPENSIRCLAIPQTDVIWLLNEETNELIGFEALHLPEGASPPFGANDERRRIEGVARSDLDQLRLAVGLYFETLDQRPSVDSVMDPEHMAWAREVRARRDELAELARVRPPQREDR